MGAHLGMWVERLGMWVERLGMWVERCTAAAGCEAMSSGPRTCGEQASAGFWLDGLVGGA